ncbi:hypothetical protein [Rariglobus hedericola]|uniref:Uncharacterized protein n=1 Tax=Rariglobus hedericola TaxID=2597822 RepID=A0A556QJX7_9BACT|nr:hypothetical protein [Rariglobus hedericola]TSJ76954.1 hypothetical protein FPL22_12625 [Rariglobus hedericola]
MNFIHSLAHNLRLALCYAGLPRKSFFMRLPALLLALTLGSTSAFAGGIEVVRLLPEYMPAASFMRVSEYFNGKENTRGATILRTQPASREGFYFNLRTKSDTAIEVAWIELQIITPVSPEARTESFAISLPRGSHLTRFGLTGKDWPSPQARPVAWKIRLLSADGAELATQQSFLWSKPDASAPAPKKAE